MIGRVVVSSALVATMVRATNPSPAAALSCVAAPPDAPRIAAVNGEVFGDRFFDEYDFAVVATVTGIETEEAPGSVTYGNTVIDTEVALVLGDAEATETIQLSAADPGWLAGYAFRVGHSYFVPVDTVGPEGQRNHTFVCTPITEVADADATADRLAALAGDAGVAHARPGDTPPTTVLSAQDEEARSSSSSSFSVASIALTAAVTALLVASATAVVVRRVRRSGTVP